MSTSGAVTNMSSPQDTYIIRLHPGEEIFTKLQQFVKDENLQAAYIITCVGSVTKATLRMADSATVCGSDF